MLSFVNPGFLALLLPLPFWLRPRATAGGWRYVSLSRLGAAVSRVPRRNWLRVSILACLVVILSGPRVPDERTRLPARGLTMMFVLDVSGSMQTANYRWQPGEPPISRAEAARRAFTLLIRGGDVGGVALPGRSGERGSNCRG